MPRAINKLVTNKFALSAACLAIATACDREVSDPTSPEATPLDDAPRKALANTGGGVQALEVAEVTASAQRANKAPQKTLDGNLHTRWQAWGEGQWIQFDLGGVRSVREVKIAWFRGAGRVADFDIETSVDGKAWEPISSGESSGRTGSLESYDIFDGEARYVRIVGNGTSVSPENLIAEVEIWGGRRADAQQTPDLSTSKALAVVDVRASAHEGNHVPRNALDGNLETRWQSRGDRQWIGFDLGRVRPVGSVRIAWFDGNDRVASFDVRTATNLSSWDWTPVYSGKSSGKSAGFEAYDIADSDARYVLILVHGTTASPDNMIAEVEILGQESPTETPGPPPGGENPPPPPSPSRGTRFSDDFERYPVNSQPQGHIANGFTWAPGSAGVRVSDDYAYSGTKSLRFAYPGKPDPAKMSSQEKRFVIAPEGTTSIDEIWVEFMIRVPDNWEHRDSESSDNNKLLALWAEDYSQSRSQSLVIFEWGRGTNSVSSFNIASGAGEDPRAIRQLQGREGVRGVLFDTSMRGQWIRLRFYIKISTLGIIRGWRDNELVADLPFPYNTAILGGRNYLRHGYLMGWSNSGFTQDTDFYIDDFKIWTTDPNWTF